MTHTPTPWKVTRGDSSLSVGLRGDDGRQVASSSWHDSSPHYPTQATTIANFEFIVAAVNSYTDHIAALEAVKTTVKSVSGGILEELRVSAAAIREWMPSTLPENAHGQIHFARALAEDAAEAIEEFLETEIAPALAPTYPSFECQDCIGMKDHGCYCANMGADAPGGSAIVPSPALEDNQQVKPSSDLIDELRSLRGDYRLACTQQAAAALEANQQPDDGDNRPRYSPSRLRVEIARAVKATQLEQSDYEQRILTESTAKDQVIERLRAALSDAADRLTRVHDDAFKQAAGYGLVTSDGRDFSCHELNRCQTAAGKARAALSDNPKGENNAL